MHHTDCWFDELNGRYRLPAGAADTLGKTGFIVIPGPVAAERMPHFIAAYDAAVASGKTPDLRIGSTATRMYDFVNRGSEVDGTYVHPPLLAACSHFFRAPFKLSSSLGRTVRPHSPAQDLHVDIARNSTDLPMLGFILMVDPFRPDNGATRFMPGSHLWPEIPDSALVIVASATRESSWRAMGLDQWSSSTPPFGMAYGEHNRH